MFSEKYLVFRQRFHEVSEFAWAHQKIKSMKKEIKVINQKEKIIQITTIDERWYAKESKDKKTGLPEYAYYPSSTWIAGYYPKGIGFYKWLAGKGWDEAEALKVAAGEKGSKVHQATELLEKGETISIDSKLVNPNTLEEEELTVEEYEAIISYGNWFNAVKPEVLAVEMVVFNEENVYAGTLDRIIRIGGQIWIVDLKTSKSIWQEHILQISSYSHADINYKELKITDEEWKDRKVATLQIGYQLNKNRYKFTEQIDKFDLFLNAKQTWTNENPEAKPKQRDLPLSIKLELPVAEKVEPDKKRKVVKKHGRL